MKKMKGFTLIELLIALVYWASWLLGFCCTGEYNKAIIWQ